MRFHVRTLWNEWHGRDEGVVVVPYVRRRVCSSTPLVAQQRHLERGKVDEGISFPLHA